MDNQWHHVAYVFDAPNASFKLYYDGDFAAIEEAIPTSVSAHSGNNAIGAMRENTKLDTGDNIEGSGLYFNGILDEVRFYDRALSESEIQELSFVTCSNDPATYSNETRQAILPCVEIPLYTDVTGQPIELIGLYSTILEIPFGFSDFEVKEMTFSEIIETSNPMHV